MATLKFEWCVSVADLPALTGLVIEGTDLDDTELTSEDMFGCIDDVGYDEVVKDIASALKVDPSTLKATGFKVTELEHVENDSGNWTHAGAYYSCTVEGHDDILKQVKDIYDPDCEEN